MCAFDYPPPPHTHTHSHSPNSHTQAFTRGLYDMMKEGLGVTGELPGAPKQQPAAAAADADDSEEASDKSEL
jgi:hypothetical protein